MSKWLLLLIGGLLLGLLAWMCIGHHVPSIEKDLETRSAADLRAAGIAYEAPAASSVKERRVVRLRGYEGSPQIGAEAQRIAAAVYGVGAVEVEAIPRPAAAKAQEEITEVLKLDIVEFETGSAKLTPKGQATLDKVAAILARVPDLPVGISGHTDSRGARPSNIDLSKSRADSCKAYLVGKGIAETRLTAEGFGPDRPVDSNETDAGRQRNRRIEFSVKEVVVKKTN